MPKKEITEDERKERVALALEFQEFREKFKFSQKLLSQTLTAIETRRGAKCPGVSRRTIQQIESAAVRPHAHTLELFNELKSRHTKNKVA